jgi:hypothetical protein
MDGSLESYTLGRVYVLRGGEPIAGLSQRKAEALSIYLASTPRSQPGEVLADLFLTAALGPPTFQSISKTNCAGAPYRYLDQATRA